MVEPEMSMNVVSVGPWRMLAVEFKDSEASLSVPVVAPVGNSITTSQSGKRRTEAWKRAVAVRTKAARNRCVWSPGWAYAVSVGFAFSPALHGYQPLDVENFLKPALDALAAGLFCPGDQDASAIERYDYDDSGFRYLFVQRLADARSPDEEGAALYVSAVVR